MIAALSLVTINYWSSWWPAPPACVCTCRHTLPAVPLSPHAERQFELLEPHSYIMAVFVGMDWHFNCHRHIQVPLSEEGYVWERADLDGFVLKCLRVGKTKHCKRCEGITSRYCLMKNAFSPALSVSLFLLLINLMETVFSWQNNKFSDDYSFVGSSRRGAVPIESLFSSRFLACIQKVLHDTKAFCPACHVTLKEDAQNGWQSTLQLGASVRLCVGALPVLVCVQGCVFIELAHWP